MFQQRNKVCEIEREMVENRKAGINRIALFLDYDGVINIFYREGTRAYEAFMKRDLSNLDFSDRNCMSWLSKLCSEFPISIIVSSSWRLAGVQYCQSYLDHGGYTGQAKVEDVTTVELDGPREEQIIQYLNEHPDFSDYLILDDLDMPVFGKHRITTDPYTGFDEVAYRNAVSLLKSGGQNRL